MSDNVTLADPTTDWQRSDPDVIVYLPRGGDRNDGDNEHFLVFAAPKGDGLLAMWTQSTREAYGDNHVVLARSSDGVSWSDPEWIVGTHRGTEEMQASWGFPVVSSQGRLYCFYTKAKQGVKGGPSGTMGGLQSDDDGRTWTAGPDTVVPATLENPDNLDSEETGSFIVWQKPIRDSQGRCLVGYSRWCKETGCGSLFFMRFDNTDQGPDIADIEFTWLPDGVEGVGLPRYVSPQGCEEPSLVLLPDGRLFTTMRTQTGYVWYSVSADDGVSWRDPEVLRYQDNGTPIVHPLAPCPIYPFRDGQFLLLFHNNDHHARNQVLGEELPPKHPGISLPDVFCYRRPAYLALGRFRADAHQPLWFNRPKQVLDTGGVPVGPKRTDEIATYTSITKHNGRWTLWFPDRKYYLLGKFLTDELVAELAVE